MRSCALQFQAIDPNNLTVVIQSVAPNEPHQLTTDSGALIYLYNQSLAAEIAQALLANKVSNKCVDWPLKPLMAQL